MIHKLTPAEWEPYSQAAHMAVFSELRAAGMDRIDYVLVAEEENQPLMYMKCREFDRDTVYISSGGALPGCKGTPKSWLYFQEFLAYLEANYKQATLLTLNDNFAMLKFSLKAGFKTIGIRNFKGYVLLEQFKDFTEITN